MKRIFVGTNNVCLLFQCFQSFKTNVCINFHIKGIFSNGIAAFQLDKLPYSFIHMKYTNISLYFLIIPFAKLKVTNKCVVVEFVTQILRDTADKYHYNRVYMREGRKELGIDIQVGGGKVRKGVSYRLSLSRTEQTDKTTLE